MSSTTLLLQGAAARPTGINGANALRARLDQGALCVSPVVAPLHGTALPFAGDHVRSLAISTPAATFTRDDAMGLPPRGAPV